MPALWRLVAEDVLAEDYHRKFMIEKLIEIPKMSKVTVNMSLADFKKCTILAKDYEGRDLLVHSYKQAISGGPYYNENKWNYINELDTSRRCWRRGGKGT